MASTIKLMALMALASAVCVCATPIVDDGGIDRFAKVRSFSSSLTDIDGDREEESEMSDEAFENDEPIYIIKGERRYDPEDGERIAYDMINPEENNHLHYDRINGETNEFEEPLDNFEIDESDDYDGDEDYDDDRIERILEESDESNEEDYDYKK